MANAHSEHASAQSAGEILVVGLDGPITFALSRIAATAGVAVRHFGNRSDLLRFFRQGEAALPDSAREAIGATPPFQRIEVDGVSLAYNDEGSGPVVVCLHATGHGARDFEGLRVRLKDEFRVLAIDWPGQGRSSNDHQTASVVRYSELLEGFLDKLAIDRVVLVGNSIGGGAALHFAARHPQRVRGLVVQNPAGLAAIDPVARKVLRSIARMFAAGAAGAPWFPTAFAAFYQSILPNPAAREQRTRIVAAGVESAPVLAQAWASFAEPAGDLRSLARDVRAPVLVTWSIRDRLNRLGRSRSAIAQIPNVRTETYDGGHCPHLENLDEFEPSLRRFLRALPSGSATN